MAKLSVISCNCQGLGDFRKRKDVFHYLREKKFDIYFLQDTHFEKKIEKQIRAEWGYESFFASFNSQSRGVAILLNNTFDFKVNFLELDPLGNFIILKLDTMEKSITLINIYGPNRDNPDFYSKINRKIEELNLTNIIWAGDWNLVLNPNLDYHNYRHNNNPRAQERVIEIMNERELVDIWREINPEILQYTWRRTRPLQQSRLDFFLISESLLPFIKDSNIKNGYRTDHSFVSITLEFKKEEKRRNFWKLNSSLLKEQDCINEIKKVIKTVKEQYILPVYNIDNLDEIPDSELQFTISDQLFLDVLLMEIRTAIMSYSVKKKRIDNKEEHRLEKEITQLESKLDKTEEDFILLLQKKNTLQNFRNKKVEGIILRSKARWASQGEKVTKYFCNLEKRHYTSKQMYKLIDSNGDEISDTERMVEMTKIFYRDLYKKRIVNDVSIEEIASNIPTLDLQQSEDLEGLITYEEASEVLKNMKNGKSPGTDGMTVDFFKFFWKDLGHFIVKSLNEGFKTGKMSITQREGIIVCIPKGDRPREFLKNWRPISLLNVVYKIGSSCIANRIKRVLPDLINEDQTGFVPGRYIGDNLRLLYDIIHYLQNENQPGLLVSIDFEKAFDSIDWNFMIRTLKRFGFGPDIIQWISAFYNDIKSSILVNNQASTSFRIERGCRQGDPISPYLFILCAEILACRIREDQEVNPIKVDDTEFKISQFADDTTFLLEGDRRSFEKLFDHLDFFGNISGLKLNHEKTNNVWLGSRSNSEARWLPHLDMSWNPLKFKILGLWFTNNLENIEKMNTQDKYLETKILFASWAKRSNTPIGRVAVLKSLIMSKLIYLWIMLPNPPDDLICELQDKCINFVWDGKKNKIKKSIAEQHTKEGGISIPNIKAYIQALKTTWIRRVLNENAGKWKVILIKQIPELRNINKFGGTLLKNKNANKFWKDVFVSYEAFHANLMPNTSEEFLAEPLFLNERFKIDGKPFIFQDWVAKGVLTAGSLINGDGTFKSLIEFQEEYNLTPKLLDFLGCLSTVKRYTRKQSIEIKSNRAFAESNAFILLSGRLKGAKPIYEALIGTAGKSNPCKTWEQILGKEIDWKKIFKTINQIKETKMRWFQMKIVYRILVSNSILFKMNIVHSDKCNFCLLEKDSVIHYLWECTHVQQFWADFLNLIKSKCNHCDRLGLNSSLILFGNDGNTKTDACFDDILLRTKFFIYKCRINKIKPTIQYFTNDLKQAYKVDEYVHKIEMHVEEFHRKWLLYVNLVN